MSYRNVLFVVILLFLICIPAFLSGQNKNKKATGGKPDLMVSVLTDVKTAKSPTNGDLPASGTGSLGLSFKTANFYGGAAFNVINKYGDEPTADTGKTRVFANNLLIPELSGQGISNFSLVLGFDHFYKLKPADDSASTCCEKVCRFWKRQFRRMGINFFWKGNNNVWKKDTVSAPIYISSLGLFGTYKLLECQLLNKDSDFVSLSLLGGWQARLLGGDYGQAGNDSIRMHFLGVKNVNFWSQTIGFRLDIGKFYGQVQETYVYGKYDIPGFSGWQAVVTVGVSISLNIPARKIL